MDNPKPSGSPPYGKVLILGAIAAASAFVVTILIVLVCVGCQRKNKPKHAHAGGENHKSVDTNLLRQSKLNPMSKSDTRLHEMHRVPCSVNGGPKSRPASMDLLLLHSRRSNSDLRVSNARLLPQVPNSPGGEEREHTYSEVGYRASPSRCLDDGLYESVGVKGTERDPEAPPPAPPPTSANTPAQRRAQSPVSSNGNGTGRGRGVNGISLEPVTAEYASIRKVRKVERGQRRENNGMEQTDVELQRLSSAEPTTSTLQRKAIEPFHLPNFPKEAVFIGNGEQYIWKPPEEDDIIIPSGPPLENGQGHSTAAEISEMYSTVCKTQKKKPTQEPPHTINGQMNAPAGEGGVVGVQGWPGGGAQEEARGRRRPQDDHCYELVGEKTWSRNTIVESDPAYATIDSHRKRERQACHVATLRPKKKPTDQQQQEGPGRVPTNENFYESISDVKQGASASSTTTIFTFNDGMEMYVTGL